ncbi:hypothetical protein ACFXOD_28860 [Streptomyces sp. NPDC059161]|uniref:hypothetical protein n=1 Tax=Streptomyces sp. NPDC059161 TaxID=3346749 RepID=UPI0036BC83CB
MDQARHRRHPMRHRFFLVPLLVTAMGLAASGCNSGGEPAPRPPEDTGQTQTPTGRSGGITGQPTDTSSGRQPDGDHGFNSAGRLSGNFSGSWPHVSITLTNPSTQDYTGTASLSDCTPGKGRWSTKPNDQSVSLAAGSSSDLNFDFPKDTGPNPIPAHTVCLSLTGRSSPLSDSIPDPNYTPPGNTSVGPDTNPSVSPSTPPVPNLSPGS